MGVIIVTGGSRGIGAATARHLGRGRHTVLINYRQNEAVADAVVSDIEITGGRAAALQGDISREEDVRTLFQEAEQFGPLVGLVNNAGVTGPLSRLEALPAEAFWHVMEVNVLGSFLCAQEAIKRMSTERGGDGGAIVNVSSRAASLGSPNEWIHYAASKGAIDSLTIGLAKEVAKDGIRVNAVRPGLIDTDIHAAAGALDRVSRLAPTIPLQRAGTAEEIAEMIVFLLSDKASYMTGALVDIGGGR